jgi:3-methylcrotonyl-CoA carboxylase alpha subunit
VALSIKPGDRVKAGQTLLVMEAMKMEHAIKAAADGVISAVFFQEGELVSEGDELLILDIPEKEPAP